MANLIMDWLSSHYAVEHPPSPLPEKMSVFQERTLTVLTTNFPSLLHRLQPISILPSSCLKVKPKPAHPEAPRLPAFAHPGAPASAPLRLLKRSLCLLAALSSLRGVQRLWCPVSTAAAGRGTAALVSHPEALQLLTVFLDDILCSASRVASLLQDLLCSLPGNPATPQRQGSELAFPTVLSVTWRWACACLSRN